MAEQTEEFEREAFRAAGPVFLVAIGLLLLSLLAILALLGGLPPGVALLFGAAGVGALLAGAVWAAAQRARQPGRAPGQRSA